MQGLLLMAGTYFLLLLPKKKLERLEFGLYLEWMETGSGRDLTRRCFPAWWLPFPRLENFLPVKRLEFPVPTRKAVCFQ